MTLERQKILIDIDDTFLKSSEEIIRQLNNKNNTNKTLDDLTDYGYLSIDDTITQDDIKQMYSSDEFFDNVFFNDGAIDFIIKYSKIFDIVFVSYGTYENLLKKLEFLVEITYRYNLTNIYFITCETGKSCKDEIILDHTYLAIDNHIEHLNEFNAPKKILLKNFQDVKWNKTPINDINTYVVNTFNEIGQMIDFDLQLKELGVLLDA